MEFFNKRVAGRWKVLRAGIRWGCFWSVGGDRGVVGVKASDDDV